MIHNTSLLTTGGPGQGVLTEPDTKSLNVDYPPLRIELQLIHQLTQLVELTENRSNKKSNNWTQFSYI